MGRLIDVEDINLKALQVAARDDDGDAYVSVRDVVRLINQTPSADLKKIQCSGCCKKCNSH